MRFSTVDRTDERSVNVRNQIINECKKIGWIYDEQNPELIVCIGGDGTFLRAIHQYIDRLDDVYFG